MEQWKVIDNYPDYMVSNMGNVRSLKKDTTNGVLLNTVRECSNLHNEEECGFYVRVTLCNNQGQCTKKVHRLVAEAFLPNPNNYPYVNHKNGIKNDNRVENLEWCDQVYNSWHAVNVLNRDMFGNSKEYQHLNERIPKKERGKRKAYECKRIYLQPIKQEHIDFAQYTDKYAVVMISKFGDPLKAFHSASEAARYLNKKNSGICFCCNRKKNFNMAYGYIWRYVRDYDKAEFEQFRGRKVVQYTEWGIKVKEYEDLIEAAKENDCCILNLIDCINGVVDTAFHSKWCFLEDYKEVTTNRWLPIVQLTIDRVFVKEYPTITLAAKDNDTAHVSRIYESCKSLGERTSGGYRWMYKKDYNDLI